MRGIENKEITLCLNKAWQPIGKKTVKEAIIALAGSSDMGTPPMIGVNVEYPVGADGEYDFSKPAVIQPIPSWEEWLKLPIRPYDLTISTTKMQVRVPTIIISQNFNKMPMRHVKLTKRAVMERDNFTCCYTGKKLPQSKLNIDHYVPKSKGGTDSWTNLVTCSKEINSKKGDKMAHEVGLSLLKKPGEPKPMPMWSLITKAMHRDWEIFLLK